MSRLTSEIHDPLLEIAADQTATTSDDEHARSMIAAEELRLKAIDYAGSSGLEGCIKTERSFLISGLPKDVKCQ